MKSLSTRKRFQAGNSLIEVLIGIVIFALGMMALAQLQGSLSKSSADSNARSVAINIAEEFIEDARSFSQVTSGAGADAFNDIVTGTTTVSRGNVNYTVATDVTDYYYNRTTGSFGTTKPNANIVNPDMKVMRLTVGWGVDNTGTQNLSFQIDETQSTTGLGTGQIELVDVISSITSISGGKVILNSTTNQLYGPPVDYQPGQNPDIIPIQLGENRFKESTTPQPDVIRDRDGLVETKFDVVTYSQSDSGATFLRREEFRAVTCECDLKFSTTGSEGGYRPTIWNGNDYTEGEFVAKTYGVPTNNQQASLCTVCCRDHHDGGTGANDLASDRARSRYDPFKSSSEYYTSADGVTALVGNHKHYKKGLPAGPGIDPESFLALADGDTYEESCRLVRKDGFFRVAQDLRQETHNSFPANYLDDEDDIAEYSDYVTDAVTAFKNAAGDGYESLPPSMKLPIEMVPTVVFPASTLENATTFNTSNRSQQLRSRGVYIDYLTDEIRTILTCMGLDGETGSSCGVPGANTALEVLPFYDVQLTWLANWSEADNSNTPIDVTNEPIQSNNAHSKGLASLTGPTGTKEIWTDVHTGNLGLTGTDPIDPWYNYDLRRYSLFGLAVNGLPEPPPGGFIVAGLITSIVGGVQASDVEIEFTDAQCNRTPTGFECQVSPLATNPRLTVSGYFKRNKNLYACSSVLTVQGNEHSGDNPAQNWTRFILPIGNESIANITIKEGSC